MADSTIDNLNQDGLRKIEAAIRQSITARAQVVGQQREINEWIGKEVSPESDLKTRISKLSTKLNEVLVLPTTEELKAEAEKKIRDAVRELEANSTLDPQAAEAVLQKLQIGA